jgi:hypothetical protein
VVTTLLFDERESQLDVDPSGDELRIPLDRLEAATGWHESPQGLCRGERCIPVPPGARWVESGHFNVSAFAAHRRQGLARDPEREIWSFGPAPESRLAGGEAPDFTLPDFEGRSQSLSAQRGKKVLLMTWASW